MEEWGKRGVSMCKFSIAQRTSGSEADEAWTCLVRARSRAPITAGSRHMAMSVLSMVVSIRSRLERVLVGAIFVPGVTCQTMLKFCRNNDHLACHLDSLQGSLM